MSYGCHWQRAWQRAPVAALPIDAHALRVTSINSKRIPIGERIQLRLDEIGQTASWLADRVGVSRSTITRIIKGERNPTPETLQEIAPVLGVDLDQLAAGTDAAERVKEAHNLVARKDYEEAVRQVIEYQRQATDLTATVRELRERAEHERERARCAREDAAKAAERCAAMEFERDTARRLARDHEEEARRYREGLERAVADVAQLQAQVRELGAAVDAGRNSSRVGAILAGVAAVVSVASYLGDDPNPKAKKKAQTASGAPRTRQRGTASRRT